MKIPGFVGSCARDGHRFESHVLQHHPARPKRLDLFCGGGGSSWGAKNAGVEMVGAVDAWDLVVEGPAPGSPPHGPAHGGPAPPRSPRGFKLRWMESRDRREICDRARASGAVSHRWRGLHCDRWFPFMGWPSAGDDAAVARRSPGQAGAPAGRGGGRRLGPGPRIAPRPSERQEQLFRPAEPLGCSPAASTGRIDPLVRLARSVRIDLRVVSLAKAPTDSMTPTTKLATRSIASWKGWRAVTASFSNFVVAIPRDSDRSPMRARPLDPWAKFLLLVVLMVVLVLVVFAPAQVTPTP